MRKLTKRLGELSIAASATPIHMPVPGLYRLEGTGITNGSYLIKEGDLVLLVGTTKNERTPNECVECIFVLETGTTFEMTFHPAAFPRLMNRVA